MSDASDIITYIGVPLAVIGVLPILYTFVLSIITQRKVRAKLIHHGHKPVNSQRQLDGFTIRSSPMTSLIEVELPRYTIAPLDRNDESYWKNTPECDEVDREHHNLLSRSESTLSMIEEGKVLGYLRGGSWRAFNWKKLIVGRKLYRLQYEDDLREPQAEIDFEDLIHFLLDWGAVPDAMGWEKLRSGGLWTPTGTILLRKPSGSIEARKSHIDWVLRTSVPDESDGVLSLSVRWTYDLGDGCESRGASSLAPGWIRLRQPTLLQSNEKADNDRKDLSLRIQELKEANKQNYESTSCRFRAESGLVSHLHWEKDNIVTGFVTESFHTHEQSLAAPWFTYAASAVATSHPSSNASGLWGVELPSDLSTFVHKDSVPCGVLVILELLAESDAPEWSSTDSTAHTNPGLKQLHRFEEQRRLQKLEATMPPEQARVHKMNREAEMRRQQMDDMRESLAAARAKEEQRIKDAIASPRMNIQTVATACLAWLIEQRDVGKEWTLEDLAEAVLYLIILDQQEDGSGRKVVQILEEWKAWSIVGGMKKQQFQMLAESKLEFCYAVSLVAVIEKHSKTDQGKAGADMLECFRTWRKVRIG